MGALVALLLGSKHSLHVLLGALVLPKSALLQPVALLGDSDGGERWPPRRRLVGLAHLPAVSIGSLDILSESWWSDVEKETM